jgi:uncharacterized circularly permuted ATP-grasp superfamily protein
VPPFDEAVEASGTPRPHYAAVLDALGGRDLPALQARIRAEVLRRGVQFGETGPDAFVVDVVPRLVPAEEWDALVRGLDQRLGALEAFLQDAYGEQRIFAAGAVPRRLLETAAHYEPDMEGAGVTRWIGYAGLDVVRGPDGRFSVLEDNVRMPTGPGFATAAWEIVAELLGDVLPPVRAAVSMGVDGLAAMLRTAGPRHAAADPAVAVLGDDPSNHAHWEITDLARRLGAPFVRLEDLLVRGGRLFRRDEHAGAQPVDVLYRRANDHLLRREDGTPAPLSQLLGPLRAETLTVLSAPGAGLADDKLAHVHVPAMIRFYLDEAPLLDQITGYDLADEDTWREQRGRLRELVIKLRDRVGGEGMLMPGDEGEALSALEAAPGDAVAQEVVELSVHPTLRDGALVPRHVDLRPLAYFDGRAAQVVPGGLTRVGLDEGARIVNMAQGGGIKGTWALT